MTPFQPTAAQIAARVNEFTTEAEAVSDLRWDEAVRLRTEFDRLAAFDSTEYKEHVDSAFCNAADTLREHGISDPDRESPEYWQMAVATLDCLLDSAGIDTRRPR